MLRAATPERLSAFSDGVFAVLITVLVLDLRPPEGTRLSFYAAVFFLVNATYILLIRELIDRSPVDDVPPKVRRIMRVRSITTLCLFAVAAVIALKYPLAGLGICICCLIVYLKPDPPETEKRISPQ